MSTVITGLEKLKDSGLIKDKSERLGLLANPASVDRDFRHAKDIISKTWPGQLKVLFSPQHGFYAEKQDNMIESEHLTDPELGIPVYSLYHRERKPSSEMMDQLDTLIVDIQDVGTRVYTFIYTLSYCMEAAAESGKRIVVLDRPNPVGGNCTEGNILTPEYASFVGRYPIPMRHGLTIGEIARLFNEEFGIGCNLDVVPMVNWERGMYFQDTGLPWVMPSPNLPTPDSAIVYPGQVIFEGTNLSEGRGTTRPFELTGSPFISFGKMVSFISSEHLKGILLRPLCFEPTSNKWSGETCYGFQIHLTDLNNYKPYLSSLALMQAMIATSDGLFEWKQPPYEYEYEKLPIDLIIGDRAIRQRIEALEDMSIIEKDWLPDLHSFNRLKERFHLYN